MKKINRKRLNNKGFTLVELLAVVVILALVMGIAASSMLNTMNSSRKSTLHSAAQTAATNLNNWINEDLLVNDASKHKVGTDFVKYTQSTKKDEWICLDYEETITNADGTTATQGIKDITNGGTASTLVKAIGFSGKDLVINGSGSVPVKGADADGNVVYAITDSTCSALRYNSTTGGYELFLNALSGGKYYVASEDSNYAFSRAEAANQPLKD